MRLFTTTPRRSDVELHCSQARERTHRSANITGAEMFRGTSPANEKVKFYVVPVTVVDIITMDNMSALRKLACLLAGHMKAGHDNAIAELVMADTERILRHYQKFAASEELAKVLTVHDKDNTEYTVGLLEARCALGKHGWVRDKLRAQPNTTDFLFFRGALYTSSNM